MKDSEAEREDGGGDQAAAARHAMLEEVFELQMGMLWLAQQAMRELTAQHELHPPHLMILNLLEGRHPGIAAPNQGGLSMSDVSRSMDVPPATATSLIDRMTAQGLVARGPSEQDRRVVMVQLTERGRAVLHEVNTLWQQVQREAFTVLSDEQLGNHLALMRRLQQGYLERVSGGPSPTPPRPQEAS